MATRNYINPAVSSKKQKGAHFTPSELADFLAQKTLSKLEKYSEKSISVLDPACGDGQLLISAIDELHRLRIKNWDVVGIEADDYIAHMAQERLSNFNGESVQIIVGDFLELQHLPPINSRLCFDTQIGLALQNRFDVVIANPPYVRTQVLGSSKAQKISNYFNLSGRVDLYHAFIISIANVLKEGGLLGIIISNRFMTTLAGQSVRAFLGSRFELREIIDLGDTKLFNAAVLPAILIAQYRGNLGLTNSYDVSFTKVYSVPRTNDREPIGKSEIGSIIDAISNGKEGIVCSREGIFNITRGKYPVYPGKRGVWSLMSCEDVNIVEKIRYHSKIIINDIARVRVGIKTTADNVFIHNDWEDLPHSEQPEPELLRTLLCHEDASRWALSNIHRLSSRVLYPYERLLSERRVVNLYYYPRTLAYLERHRKQLEAREYITKSGRAWFEIWVPQDPSSWSVPKIVFPDISAEPKFYYLDEDYIVNGDCYWISLRSGVDPEMLYLILGVANSKLMTKYHDVVFTNKLYAARRRYMTQYVSKYPLPDTMSTHAKVIIELTRKLIKQKKLAASNNENIQGLESELDSAVHRAFGIDPKGISL
jgi:adenine-specific DNA-methyltransferase